MSPDREHRLEELFSAARDLPPLERTAFLDRACGDDAELRRQADSLLAAHEQAGRFLQPTVAPSTLKPPVEKSGDRIGHYKLLEPIGEGGFGVVWMAEQEEPVRRRVALKIIKLGMDTREVVARFEAERQALAMMEHPNIARVFDGGATGTGRPYFVMELVKGVPITEYCDATSLATRERLELFMQVCHAVQHAHQKGIIHRDLKPSNILVTVQDDKPVPKVIDFGVAKATQARLTDKTVFTRFHQCMGTPAYMSPEQAGLGSFDVDTRSDIYSLGVLLYELLTGQPPFDTQKLLAAGFEAVMRTIREAEPPKPSTRLSTLAEEELWAVAARRSAEPVKLSRLVRGDLDWVAMKALEKDRTRRYETASAFAQDLAHFLAQEPVSAAAPAVGYRVRKFARRNRLVLSTAGLFVLIVLAGATVSTWEAVRATRFARQAARQERLATSEAARATLLAAESESARRRADEQAAVAAAVNEFLEKDLLARAVPWSESEEKPEPELKVRTVLDRASEKIGGRFTNQPLVEASLRETMANTYHSLGLYALQELHARRSAELYIRELGETNTRALRMLAAMGDSQRHLGRVTEALAQLHHVRQTQEQVFGPIHTNTLRTVNLLAATYADARQYERARTLLEEALGRTWKTPVGESSVADELRNNLAVVLWREGNLPEAEALFRRMLVQREKQFGETHAEVASTLNNLAAVLGEQGKSPEAEKMFRQALDLRRKLFGPEHPEVAASLDNLGLTHVRRGALSEAEQFFRDALAMREKLLGPEHQDVADSLGHLALLLQTKGKLEEAEGLYRRSLDITQELVGKEHLDVLPRLNSLAGVLWKQQKLAAAEPLLRRVLALSAKLPETNEVYEAAMLRLGDLLLDQGKCGEAEGCFQAVLKLRAARFGSDSPGYAEVLTLLAGLYIASGRSAEAEPPLRRATQILDGQPIPQDASALQARLLLMTALKDQGKRAEAESVLEDIQGRLKSLPRDQPTSFAIIWQLSAALRLQGRMAESEALWFGNWQAALWGLKNPEGIQRSAWKLLTVAEALQEFGPLIEATSPTNMASHVALWGRAALYGRQGRSQEAAQDFARWFKLHEDMLALPLVALWMDSGDVSGYEGYARDLWSHYNRSPARLMGPFRYSPARGWERSDRPEGDPATGAGVALALAIYPHAQSYKDIDTLAARAVQRGAKHPFLPRFQTALGLVEYRFGRFESAAGWARRSLAGTNVEPTTVAMANAVLALARQGLHHAAEAAEALRLAQDVLRTNLPPRKDGTRDLGENWPDWLMAELLVKEAARPEIALTRPRASSSGEALFPPELRSLKAQAEKGDADAQCSLGTMFSRGDRVLKDDTEAVNWYRSAAEQKHALAQYELASALFNGRGVPRDDAEAIKWARKSAEQRYANAEYLLGYMLMLGRGENGAAPEEALKWVRKSAEKGYVYAQLELGLAYLINDSVSKDPAEGIKWLRKAAEQGNAQAQANLGHFLKTGQGIPKDEAEAIKWFRKAAEQGWAPAQSVLGDMLLEGVGAPKEPAQAIHCYQQAAEQGDPSAQLKLGLMFAAGTAVPTNKVNAYMWFNLAAARGVREAVTNRARVEGQMTSEQVSEAKRLSAQFVPRKVPTDAPW